MWKGEGGKVQTLGHKYLDSHLSLYARQDHELSLLLLSPCSHSSSSQIFGLVEMETKFGVGPVSITFIF